MPKSNPKVRRVKESVVVSWSFGMPVEYQIDFGMFPAHSKNQIKFPREQWSAYCDARIAFEILHHQLFECINKRGRDSKRVSLPKPPKKTE